jgi:hypothetical protein
MQCSDAEALAIMHAWNAGNTPPLADEKVGATWQNSATYNARPYRLREGVRRVS